MKHELRKPVLLLGAVLLAGFLAGCGTTRQTRFYALQPMPEVYAASRDHCGEGLLIGVGPILTPKYLERQQVAVVANRPEIFYSEFNRWAGPLDENISNVLIQNLGALLASCRIVRFPWIKNIPAEYWVVVQIDRFDGVPGAKAVLDMDWLVYAAGRENLRVIRSVYLEEPVPEKSYAALVKAQGALLAEASRRMADDLRALSAKAGGAVTKDESKGGK